MHIRRLLVFSLPCQLEDARENEVDYIKMEFKDNGMGIEDSRKELIFQEADQKREDTRGMGLGLSLVAKFLELCDGKIWVEDRVSWNHSQGSNFIILIPEALVL